MAVRRPARAGAPRGQHYLRSNRLAADIVACADITRADLVVDAGAGTGMLTRPLAATGARVIALELDALLARELRRRFAGSPRVRVETVDATTWQWPDEPFAVVANLPFAAAAGVLRALLDDPSLPLTRGEVIVQWELARKRATAWPSTLRSVYWSAWFELGLARHLAPTAFAPPPSVDAGVLSIRRRAAPLVPLEDARAYGRFVAHGFASPAPLRRTLPPLLSTRELKRLATVHGFAAGACARDLDPHQWAALFASGAGSGETRGGRGTTSRG